MLRAVQPLGEPGSFPAPNYRPFILRWGSSACRRPILAHAIGSLHPREVEPPATILRHMLIAPGTMAGRRDQGCTPRGQFILPQTSDYGGCHNICQAKGCVACKGCGLSALLGSQENAGLVADADRCPPGVRIISVSHIPFSSATTRDTGLGRSGLDHHGEHSGGEC